MGLPKTPAMVLYAYVWFLLAGPPFFYSLFYALYYADAMGDSSDYHCVVDLTSAAKMEKPIPLDYKAAGVTTEGLPDFIAKNPAKYQDITESWRGMMLFGMIVQIILFLLGVAQAVKFEPSPEPQKDPLQAGLSCAAGVASLVQVIMTLVARCSYAGSICAGDYLPDPPTERYAKLLPYYEKDDGYFLFVTPIVMLSISPIMCLLSLCVLPMIVIWAIASGAVKV